MPSTPSIYTNPAAKSYNHHSTANFSFIQKYHESLPEFEQTPLVSLPSLAKELGISRIFVKDESSRCGLPAFKILGASWATFRAITNATNIALNSTLEDVSAVAKRDGISLYAATDGNHGRAVARMASLLGIPANIYVPRFTDKATQDKIASEGARVTPVPGDYDAAVTVAYRDSLASPSSLLIQDNAFDGYEDVPEWCSEGYSTMLLEIDQQLSSLQLKPTVLVTPVGVGSLAHAVVSYAKSTEHDSSIRVLAIEPEKSGCLHTSLKNGENTTIETSTTIMDGMNCGTVSPVAWPALRDGVDASVTITDRASHEAVQYLQSHGVNAGPCGAGGLAGLRRAVNDDGARTALGLRSDIDSVVVLICTEGKRDYTIPEDS